jgi:Tfp pilus assembly protein PilF
MPDSAWQVIAAVAGALTVGLLALIGFLLAALGITRLRNVDQAVGAALRQLNSQQDATVAEIQAAAAKAKADLSDEVIKDLAELAIRRGELEGLSSSLAWAKEATLTGTDLSRPETVHQARRLAEVAMGSGQRTYASLIFNKLLDSDIQGSAPEWLNAAMTASGLDPTIMRRLDERGLKEHPNNVDLLADYGDTLSKLERFDEADEYFERAAAQKDASQSWRYWVQRANHLIKNGRYAEAKDLLEQAVKSLPGSAMMLRESANLAAAQGQGEEAAQLFERAVSLEPEEEITHLEYGQFLFNRGKYEQAEKQLQLAILLGGQGGPSRWAASHVLLGKNYLAQGRVEDAARAFAVALAANGDNRDARLFQRKLEIEAASGPGHSTSAKTPEHITR